MAKKSSMQRTSVRLLMTFLAVSHFGTQCAFANAPESAFWEERRRSRRQNHPSDQPLLMAGLPSGSSSVLGQFPSLQKVSQTPSLSSDVARDLPPAFVRRHDALFSALSGPHGSLRRVSLPESGSPSHVIVHVQDVHMNADAQRNIGRIVQGLIQEKHVGLVALEGAFGPLDLGRFRAFPHQEAVHGAADQLLREDKITGPVHAAFTSLRDIPPLIGVDDADHYEANVEAYRRSSALVPAHKERLASLRRDLSLQQAAAFSPALAAFDRKVEAYRMGTIPLGDHVHALAAQAPTPLPSSIRHFMEALELESSLDFTRVESERGKLVEKLVSSLGRDQIDLLMGQAAAYRLGKLRYADFYRSLRDLCGRNGVPLSRFPSMDLYIRYVLTADRISPEALFTDLTDVEKACYAVLAKTPEEKRLVSDAARLHLAGKLVDFSLTPQEWKDYEGIPPFEGLSLASFEDFYREAHARDASMADNLLRGLRERGTSAGLLVTGGYHSPGLTRRLTAAGCAVLSVTPKMEKVDTAQGAAYLSVFNQEKTPLEKLFEGRKLFLSQRQDAAFRSGEAALRVVGTQLISEGDKKDLSERAKSYFQALHLDSVDDVEVEADPAEEDGVILTVRLLKDGETVKTVRLDMTQGPDGIIKMRQRDAKDWRDKIISPENLAVIQGLLTRMADAAHDRIELLHPTLIASFSGWFQPLYGAIKVEISRLGPPGLGWFLGPQVVLAGGVSTWSDRKSLDGLSPFSFMGKKSRRKRQGNGFSSGGAAPGRTDRSSSRFPKSALKFLLPTLVVVAIGVVLFRFLVVPSPEPPPAPPSPPAETAAPSRADHAWRNFPAQPTLESMKRVVLMAIDRLKAEGYPRSDVLDDYADALQRSDTIDVSLIMLAKALPAPGQRSDSVTVLVNPRELYRTFSALQAFGSDDFFMGTFAAFVAREAWGYKLFRTVGDKETEMRPVFNPLAGKSSMHMTYGKNPWPLNAPLSRILSQYEGDILRYSSETLAWEFWEFSREYDTYKWMIDHKKISADRMNSLLIQGPGPQGVGPLFSRFMHLEIIRRSGGSPLSILQSELQHTGWHNFTALVRGERQFQFSPMFQGTYLLLEGQRFLDAAAAGSANPPGLDPRAFDMKPMPPREAFESSARRLLPHVLEHTKTWERFLSPTKDSRSPVPYDTDKGKGSLEGKAPKTKKWLGRHGEAFEKILLEDQGKMAPEDPALQAALVVAEQRLSENDPTVRALRGQTIPAAGRGPPNGKDGWKVVFHRAKLVDGVEAHPVVDEKAGVIRIYLDGDFLAGLTGKDLGPVTAQLIRHELTEVSEGKTHTEAVLSEFDLEEDRRKPIPRVNEVILAREMTRAKAGDAEALRYFRKLVSGTSGAIADIGRNERLREDEKARLVRLANSVRKRARSFIKKIHRERRVLSSSEEKVLSERIKGGDRKALDVLITANLPFVIAVAKEYLYTGLPLGDLIGEGVFGLIKAAKKFDGTREVKFISYAVWWIRAYIVRALPWYLGAVLVPNSRVRVINKIWGTYWRLMSEREELPDREALAAALGLTLEEIEEGLGLDEKAVSLDALGEDPDGWERDSPWEDQGLERPDQRVEDRVIREWIAAALGTLDVLEIAVVRRYFGFGFDPSYSLEEIGQEFGLSKSQVANLKNKALRKLRRFHRRQKLDRPLNQLKGFLMTTGRPSPGNARETVGEFLAMTALGLNGLLVPAYKGRAGWDAIPDKYWKTVAVLLDVHYERQLFREDFLAVLKRLKKDPSHPAIVTAREIWHELRQIGVPYLPQAIQRLMGARKRGGPSSGKDVESGDGVNNLTPTAEEPLTFNSTYVAAKGGLPRAFDRRKKPAESYEDWLRRELRQKKVNEIPQTLEGLEKRWTEVVFAPRHENRDFIFSSVENLVALHPQGPPKEILKGVLRVKKSIRWGVFWGLLAGVALDVVLVLSALYFPPLREFLSSHFLWALSYGFALFPVLLSPIYPMARAFQISEHSAWNVDHPGAVLTKAKYPTKESVKDALAQREREGKASNPKVLEKENGALYKAARMFNVDLPAAPSWARFPTRVSVQEALARRERAGKPNNPLVLMENDATLYNAAREFGVDLPSIQRVGPYPTPESVRYALSQREHKGKANNPGTLQKEDNPLYQAAYKFDVKLPAAPTLPRYPTKESMQEALAQREREGKANNPKALQKSDNALYRAARRFGVELPAAPRQVQHPTRKSVKGDVESWDGVNKLTSDDSSSTVSLGQSVRRTPAFRRLEGVLGMGPVVSAEERFYSIMHHDERVGLFARWVAEKNREMGGQADPDEAEFLALTHDYAALPFRHLGARSPGFRQVLQEAGYQPDQAIVDALVRDGYEMPEARKRDIFNSDVDIDPALVSASCQAALIAGALVGLIEDVLLAARAGHLRLKDVPTGVRDALALKDAPVSDPVAFNLAVVSMAQDAVAPLLENHPLDEAMRRVAALKKRLRGEFILPAIHRFNSDPDACDRASRILLPVYRYLEKETGSAQEALRRMEGMTDSEAIQEASRLSGNPALVDDYKAEFTIAKIFERSRRSTKDDGDDPLLNNLTTSLPPPDGLKRGGALWGAALIPWYSINIVSFMPIAGTVASVLFSSVLSALLLGGLFFTMSRRPTPAAKAAALSSIYTVLLILTPSMALFVEIFAQNDLSLFAGPVLNMGEFWRKWGADFTAGFFEPAFLHLLFGGYKKDLDLSRDRRLTWSAAAFMSTAFFVYERFLQGDVFWRGDFLAEMTGVVLFVGIRLLRLHFVGRAEQDVAQEDVVKNPSSALKPSRAEILKILWPEADGNLLNALDGLQPADLLREAVRDPRVKDEESLAHLLHRQSGKETFSNVEEALSWLSGFMSGGVKTSTAVLIPLYTEMLKDPKDWKRLADNVKALYLAGSPIRFLAKDGNVPADFMGMFPGRDVSVETAPELFIHEHPSLKGILSYAPKTGVSSVDVYEAEGHPFLPDADDKNVRILPMKGLLDFLNRMVRLARLIASQA